MNYARATRDEPDLRETLYEAPFRAGTLEPNRPTPFTYADESQSGFRMFNKLDDDTMDAGAQLEHRSARPAARPTQYKFGVNYVERTRDFQSRRFHFIPITTQKADAGNLLFNQPLPPEELFTSSNIGTAFRFNEETRPVDAYAGDRRRPPATAWSTSRCRRARASIGGARVERFDQTVTTQDPFGLFVREVQATNKNTDVFPAINFVQAVGAQLEHPPQLQHDGQPAGVPRAGRVRVHRRRRQPRGAGATRICSAR